MEVKFEIWVKPIGEPEFIAFHWCRDEASGIARAEYEAPKFGYEIERAWAVPCNEEE